MARQIVHIDLVITKEALESIKNTVGVLEPERGGLLFSTREGIVDLFLFDDTAAHSKTTYAPAVNRLSEEMTKRHLSPDNFVGVVHSHRYGDPYPSRDLNLAESDESSFTLLLQRSGKDKLHFPIVQSTFDSPTFEMRVFQAEAADHEVKISMVDLRIV